MTAPDDYVPAFLRDEQTAERMAVIFRQARARRLRQAAELEHPQSEAS